MSLKRKTVRVPIRGSRVPTPAPWPNRPGIRTAWEEKEATAKAKRVAVLKVREEDVQMAVWKFCQVALLPGVVAFHPANGGWRSKAEAGRLKAMGVVPGMPDLGFIWIAHPNHWLELKTHKGVVPDEQLAIHAALRAAGNIVEVTFGVDAALDQIVRWGMTRPGVKF